MNNSVNSCPRCGQLKYVPAPVCHWCLKDDLAVARNALRRIIAECPNPTSPYGKVIAYMALGALAELEDK